jgi:hypothetical protein
MTCAVLGALVIAAALVILFRQCHHDEPKRALSDPLCVQLLNKRNLYRSMAEHPATLGESEERNKFDTYRAEAQRSLEQVENQLRAANCPL